MNKKTITSIFVSIFLLASVLVITNCSKETPKYLELVPANATGVIHFNFRDFTHTSAYKDIKQVLPLALETAIVKKGHKFLTLAGISLERDLRSLTLVLGDESSTYFDMALIFRGIYSKEKLTEAMLSDKPDHKTISYQNIPILSFKGSAEDTKAQNVCFLAPGTLVLGDLAMLKAIIDIQKGNQKPIAGNTRMGRMVYNMETHKILSGAFQWSKMDNRIVDGLKQFSLDFSIFHSLVFSMGKEEVAVSFFSDDAQKAGQIGVFLAGMKKMYSAAKPKEEYLKLQANFFGQLNIEADGGNIHIAGPVERFYDLLRANALTRFQQLGIGEKTQPEDFPVYKEDSPTDCGPVCLRIILKYYGKEYSLEKLRELCKADPDKGSSMLGVSEAAEALGMKTMGVRLSFEKLKTQAPLPCMIHWEGNYFLVVYRIEDDRIYAVSPSAGKVQYTRAEFLEGWIVPREDGKKMGLALLFEPAPK